MPKGIGYSKEALTKAANKGMKGVSKKQIQASRLKELMKK